jgi:hypothetical protein
LRANRADLLISTVKIRALKIRTLTICALAMSVALAACSSRSDTQAAPDAFVVLQNIPAASPAKYAGLQEKKNWQNPYLVIRPDGVGLLTGVTANQEQILKPEDVLDTLARLPSSAWPYGRVAAILVQEPSGNSRQSSGQGSERGSEPQKIALRRNRGTVAGELERAHIEIVWMPSPTP